MKFTLPIRAAVCVWFVLSVSVVSIDGTLAEEHHHKKHPHHGHHKAHHGGVLNVISKCEIGHIEVRVAGDLMEVWFVGGGADTDRSVPVQAEAVELTVAIPAVGERTLLLKADPMTLAGEKIGYCSRFSARADWLKLANQFEARGDIVFKGIRRPLLIKYPAGYDPGHRTE